VVWISGGDARSRLGFGGFVVGDYRGGLVGGGGGAATPYHGWTKGGASGVARDEAGG
jgi:hypothetical protein